MQRLERKQFRRGQRAVAFLWFTLIALPMMFFAASLAVDFTRIIIAGRQVTNATSAAALAGAWEMEEGVAAINRTRATAEAINTYCLAQDAGAVSLATAAGSGGKECPDGDRVTINVTLTDRVTKIGGVTSGGATTVRVQSTYQVPNLIFFGYFGQNNTYTAKPITKSASICVPGDTTGATGGNCRRPLD